MSALPETIPALVAAPEPATPEPAIKETHDLALHCRDLALARGGEQFRFNFDLQPGELLVLVSDVAYLQKP